MQCKYKLGDKCAVGVLNQFGCPSDCERFSPDTKIESSPEDTINTESAQGQKIYDISVKEMVERLPKLIIPVINMVFNENYSPDVKVTRLTDIHADKGAEYITDSYLQIEDQRYHIEWQSRADGTMALRMFRYNMFQAFESAVPKDGFDFVVELPQSCVIFLRHDSKTPDVYRIKVCHSGEDNSLVYKLPVVKIQNISDDEIIRKRLYIFLPFYLLRFEKQFKKAESDQLIRSQIVSEFFDLLEGSSYYLSNYVDDVDFFSEVLNRVLHHILRNSPNMEGDVNTKMGYVSWYEEFQNEKAKRENECRAEGEIKTLKSMNFTLDQANKKIAEMHSCTLGEAKELVSKFWDKV